MKNKVKIYLFIKTLNFDERVFYGFRGDNIDAIVIAKTRKEAWEYLYKGWHKEKALKKDVTFKEFKDIPFEIKEGSISFNRGLFTTTIAYDYEGEETKFHQFNLKD